MVLSVHASCLLVVMILAKKHLVTLSVVIISKVKIRKSSP